MASWEIPEKWKLTAGAGEEVNLRQVLLDWLDAWARRL